MAGRLHVVATPIGNLKDLTFRAVEVLKSVAFIVCEDTRQSRKLLDAYGISAAVMSLPAFAEGERAGAIVKRLQGGDDGALISDAGTPAISDPGEKLVSEALAAGVEVIPIPGASAVITALCAAGLPTGRFHFLGFLPRQVSEARAMVGEVAALSATLVLYEAPGRTVETLKLLHELLGDRRCAVARELTKMHETFERGLLSEVATRLQVSEVLGEIVVLVEGRPAELKWSEGQVLEALKAAVARGERMKLAAGDVAKSAGWSSSDVYKLGLTLK